MSEEPRDRHAELLRLARAAEERAASVTDEEIRLTWLRVAQEWRVLAEQTRRISKF